VAIAIRGTTPLVVTSATGAATISGSLTSTRQPQSGDVLIIIHGNDWSDLANMPTPTVGGSTTGVTSLTTADGGTNLAHVKAWRYTVGSTGDLTVSITETGLADEEKCLIVYVLSGADTTTVVDGTPAGSTGAATTSPAAPAVTTSTSNAFLICHTNTGGGAGVTSYTPPSGMTEQYDSNVGSAMGCTGATLQLSASGSTGTKTFTGTNSGAYAAVSIAVLTKSVSTATPSTVAGTVAVGTATARMSVAIAPAVVAATVSVGSPSIKTGSTVVPTTVAGVATVGSATARMSVAITPAVVAGSVSVGTPSIATGAGVVPVTVAGAATVGTATARMSVLPAPAARPLPAP
jgi:hypothetical protein